MTQAPIHLTRFSQVIGQTKVYCGPDLSKELACMFLACFCGVALDSGTTSTRAMQSGSRPNKGALCSRFTQTVIPLLCLHACMVVAVQAEQVYCLLSSMVGWVVGWVNHQVQRLLMHGWLHYQSALCSAGLSADSSLHGHQTQSHVCTAKSRV